MLNEDQIEKLIEEKDLIQDYFDLDIQLTPNGFDVTVGQLFEFDSKGAVDFSNSEREIPEGKEIYTQKQSPKDKYGWWDLESGLYKVRTNEKFNLPHNLTAIAFPRSSLLRMGVFTHTAVWEAGFRGKAEFLLRVGDQGVRIKQNARVTQVMFEEIKEVDQGYDGRYQNYE